MSRQAQKKTAVRRQVKNPDASSRQAKSRDASAREAKSRSAPPREAKRPEPSSRQAKSPEAPPERPTPGPRRSGRVALVGRPNVGKSTLLNAALGEPLAIVSPTPQTTRESLLGVVHRGDAELLLVDTPGLHKAEGPLGKRMNKEAREAARGADVVVFVAEVPQKLGGDDIPGRIVAYPGDVVLLRDVCRGDDEGAPAAVLALNKVDRVRDKKRLLPLLEAYANLTEGGAPLPPGGFRAIVPVSAKSTSGVDRVLDEVAALLPEAPWEHGDDVLTDRPMRFFAAEYVREQVLRHTREEVPHSVLVTIEHWTESKRATHIDATIHVEREGQKKIVVGTKAEMLKRIGIGARERLEPLLGRSVVLKLWVRVTPDWRERGTE